ncbi:hypothetical protein [Hymenobacter coalescens]
MLRLLHQDAAVGIFLDEAHDWLYVEWQPRQDPHTVRTGCATVLAHVRQQGCRRALNDSRLVCTLWADSAEWVGTEFFAQLTEAGLEYLAWVYSHSIYGRLSISQTLAYAQQPTIQTFDDCAAAAAWLQTCRVG